MEFTPVATLPHRLTTRGRGVLPGVLLCVAIAAVATAIGRVVPVLGAAIPAVLIGLMIAVVRPPTGRAVEGVGFASRFVLQCAVVLLGAQLSIGAVLQVGARSLPVMLASLAVCLLAAWGIGRALRIDPAIATLIGVGTGICGASAIAAVSPVIRAKSAQIAYAVSTIFLFNILAIVAFPLIGHLLGMSPQAFGLFAGTAVNDTSSVVAAASVYGSAALGFAVVVKLVRTLMIVPISVGLAVLDARRTGAGTTLSPKRALTLVPWFLIGFLVVALINSAGLIPSGAGDVLKQVSVFLVATALAGIGLSTDFVAIRVAGWKPLLLGGILWILVSATTLTTMTLSGYL
ncbi:YeiH family protein [Microbacterium sp. ASV81]|uniref:Sulfate exporter family transporter n=1 Tax=Microbacterium capsulatum TaxID=3041921 RepID=A0ABU0XG74_9MICO|nr:putative sulfate exporter family transporter [Microbacterium sp. ASV81]MDQ4214122.1 putative sulfate exporter family transporter [Microbacterium sp. ASV81]